MGEGNLVVFKGTADGIVVWLDQVAEFDEVLNNFKEKLSESKQFFKGSKISIRFKGRSLNEEQREALMSLLTNQDIVNISFVHQFEEEKVEEDNDLAWIKEQLLTFEGSMTHFHYGIVRSGNHVNYKGNIVILGDVNPGGLVTAGGHVIIIGTLKGKVHAGLDNKVVNPFIVSNVMDPIQIGIKNIIAQSPNGESLYAKAEKGAQIAYLYEEQIYVDQIDSKTLNHMLK